MQMLCAMQITKNVKNTHVLLQWIMVTVPIIHLHNTMFIIHCTSIKIIY